MLFSVETKKKILQKSFGLPLNRLPKTSLFLNILSEYMLYVLIKDNVIT